MEKFRFLEEIFTPVLKSNDIFDNTISQPQEKYTFFKAEIRKREMKDDDLNQVQNYFN